MTTVFSRRSVRVSNIETKTILLLVTKETWLRWSILGECLSHFLSGYGCSTCFPSLREALSINPGVVQQRTEHRFCLHAQSVEWRQHGVIACHFQLTAGHEQLVGFEQPDRLIRYDLCRYSFQILLHASFYSDGGAFAAWGVFLNECKGKLERLLAIFVTQRA